MEWDARGLVQVIKTCSTEGVLRFKLDSLEITFPEKKDTMDVVQEPTIQQQEIIYRPVSKEDEMMVEEMIKDELLISDPLAFENNAMGDEE